MSTMLIQSGTLDDIADAIRSKTGKVTSMTPLEMPDEIESISGGGSGLPILSGTSNPTASQGTNGQEYLKYVNYIYKSFFNGTVIIRENEDDATDIKLFVNGFSRENTDLVPITDSDLLAYLTDITTGKFKGCDIYNDDQSTQYAFILMNQSGNMYINVTNSTVSQRVSGTFYGGMVDLSQSPVSSAANYQRNGYKACDTNIDELVVNGFIKKNGVWQDLLENTDIDDIILSVGGGSSGVTILSGTTDPTSSQGVDGQIYLKYSDIGKLINSSRNSYIDTGYIMKNNTVFEMKCKITGGGSWPVPFGARDVNSNNAGAKEWIVQVYGGYFRYDADIGLTNGPVSSKYLNKEITMRLGNNKFYISSDDDTDEYTFTQGNPTTKSMFVFGINGAGSYNADSATYMELYSFTIYEGDTIVHNFIPAYNNNQWCLYDEIDETYLYKSGSGSAFTGAKKDIIDEVKLKVNESWQDLINSNIDDVNLGGGSPVTKKKNLIISNDTNASSLLEQVVDENFEVTNVFAGTYNSEANAYQTDLIKYFYDTVGTYGHQYYWHVIAKTDVTCDGTDYVAGDIIDYWYYNVQKTLLVEEA